MILKINNEYIDVEDVEVEKQIKLFEEIESTQGDFSYSFELENTSQVRMAIGLPMPDNHDKTVYQDVPTDLMDDNGQLLFKGAVRVEQVTDLAITCSFFSGNNNWIRLLSGPLTDVDFSDLTVSQDITSIIAAKGNTSGVTWPIVDNGSLLTRSYQQMIAEDFAPGVYVHTVFKKIFQHHSIKIQGELLSDPLYKSLTTHKNSKSKADITANSMYANKTSTTAMPVELDFYKVTFQNVTVYPFYNGADNPFNISTSTFRAKYKMRVRVEGSLTPSIIDSSYSVRIYLYINGVFTFVDVGLDVGGLYNDATVGGIVKIDRTITLESGDTLEVYSQWQQSTGSTQNDITAGTLRITPLFIYNVSGASIVPNWSQQQYVSNILRIFNCITAYDPFTKTLTINLFDKIKGRTPIDISPYIEAPEIDYIQFISNYGKRNLFSFNQVDFDDLRDYNIQNFFKYGQGVINADNDFLEDSADVLESDFSSSLGYLHPVFDMSMERMDLIELDEGESVSVTLVTDSAGQAVFTIDKDIFLVGDLVRVSDSTNVKYNGDYVVDFRSTGSIELVGVNFDTTATGTITKLTHSYKETDDVYLLSNIPDYALFKFTGKSSFQLGSTAVTYHSLAFFTLLNTGRQINQEFKQGLSFGPVTSPFFYQRTLIDSYWQIFKAMLNDPVMLIDDAYLPFKIYNDIDFLSPVFVKTLETTNLYYVNRNTGYKGSDVPCTLELIKIP